MEEEEKMHFSYDLESSLTPAERKADEKLQKLCRMLRNPHYDVVIRDFFANKAYVEKSALF